MGNDYFKKIRKMILVRVLLAPFIILLLVCGTIVYFFAAYSGRQVENELVRIAADHRSLIDQFFDERVSDLKFISSLYTIDEISKTTVLTDIFQKLKKDSKAFIDLGVFDDKGNHLAYAGPYNLEGRDYSRTAWFKAVKNKGLYISDEFLGYRNIPHFIIAVQKNDENRTWYLRATIDTFYFNDLVERIRIRKTGEAYIVNRDGIYQTKRRSGGKILEPDPDYGDYLMGDEMAASFTAGKKISEKYLYAMESLKHTEWVMIVRQEMLDAYASLIFSSIVSIMIILGGGIIVVTTGYVLASGIAEKLNIMNMEKRQMKTQLIIAGKLAEVGEMSTGIAHEINNPLQVMKSEVTMIGEVISNIEHLIKNHEPENLDLLKDSVDQVAIQIDRCGKITQGLLSFARKTESTIKPVRLQKLLPEIVRMVEQRALVENIRIIQEINQDIPEIKSDPDQLQQVFLNLLNNAIYALKVKSSGEIRIRINQQNSDIIISVADNGCGFSPENMKKAFLPFFTTKPVGEGTGLGLSTAYGIIKGLGGDMTLSSELKAGSVFSIRLPIKTQAYKNN